MSTTTTPLQYASLKTVLQHMNPNLRFQIALQMPSLARTEKLVPLKVDHLEFGNMETKVNNTLYQLEIIPNLATEKVQFLFNSIRKDVKFQFKKNRKVQRDINQFGLNDRSCINLMTPGDVNLRRDSRRTFPEVDYLEQSEDRHGKQLLSSMEQSIRCYENQGRFMDFETNDCIRSAEELRGRLELYKRRQKNVPFPCSFSIQLTVNGKIIERVKYNRKMYESLKYLNNLLFGKRTHPLKVKTLRLRNQGYIFRFPYGFKIKVLKEIHSELIRFEYLNSVIDKSNYSSIQITIMENIDEHQNQEAITSCKQLTILNSRYVGYENLTKLTSQIVRLKHYKERLYYMDLIDNWIENGKPVGTLYSFGVREKNNVKIMLRKVKSQFGAFIFKKQGRSVTLIMPIESSQLRVYYERILLTPNDNDVFKCKWSLNLKVESTY